MTNADMYFRKATDEEIADTIIMLQYREGDVCPPKHSQNNNLCLQADGCKRCWLRWLRREVK